MIKPSLISSAILLARVIIVVNIVLKIEIILTPAFVKPGNTDARNKAVYAAGSNDAWDLGFLMGQAAVCEWTVRELHFETETQNYGYNKGTGAFGESGISLVEYDAADGWAGTANNRENYGSVVLAWTAPTVTA